MEFMELRVRIVGRPGRQPFVSLYGKQTWKNLNRQNDFRTTLERLSCHNDFKITQAQTKVSFFYLNPLLQVEFGAIFEPFSYNLLNGSNVTQYCHVCKSQTTSGPPVLSFTSRSVTSLTTLAIVQTIFFDPC